MIDIIKIDENTYRLEDNGVRFFLLIGEEKALMIDSGMNVQNAKVICETLTMKPIELLNTHADPDHISGNGSFEKFYMNSLEEDNYRAHQGKGEIIPIEDNQIIDLGNRLLKIITIPGHTPGSVAILDMNNRTLISGDTVQDGNIFMFGERRNIVEFIESLKKLETMKDDFDMIYPSHGTFPVKYLLIPKLIDGATSIKNQTAEYKMIELFGQTVKLYKFPYAGFLCK